MAVNHSLSRALILALLATSPAMADERYYLGGAWNAPGSWSPEGVPTGLDRVYFDAAHAGTVFVAGGFDVEQISVFGDAAGYHFTGEGGTLGHVLRFDVDAQDTLVELASITGKEFQEGYAIGLHGNGTTEWRTSIVNTPTGQPVDAYVAGIFTRGNFNTGTTTLHNYTRLESGGAFNSTPDLVIDRAMLEIHNKAGDPTPGNRIGDGTRVGMNHGFWYIHNDDDLETTEHIAGIDLGVGHNRISSSGSDIYAPGSALVRDASKHGTLTLETAIGSTHVAPAGFGVGSFAVPWATRYGNLAYYDSGANDLPGDGDDGGFVDVAYNDISFAASTDHAEVGNHYTMNTSFTVMSATVREGRILNLNNSVLTLTDAALVLNNNATVTQGIAGRIDFAGTHGEAFVHVPYGNATVSARLSSGVGLVKGGDGNLTLSGANNISGPIHFNNGTLELASVNAVSPSNDIHLAESNIKFNYGVGGTVPNHIVFDTGRRDPLYAGSYLYDFIVKDNTNWNFSGLIEGHGPYFLRGENSKVTISGIHASTPGVADPNEDFSLWPQGSMNLEITGRLGDANNRGTVILFEGRTTGNGEVTGGMQISGAGTFAPGLNNGAGIALFKTGDISMFDGRIEMQVNGTARGTTYDAIDTGFAFFGTGGTIAITGTRTGQIGDKYELISYASGFAFDSGPMIANSLAVQSGGQWVKWIDNNGFTLAVAGPTGDSTLDGRVDFNDLLIIAQNYGLYGNWSTGDFTGDGIIDFNDLLLVAQHYGQSALTQTDTSLDFDADWTLARTVVPEPATFGILVCGTMLRRRRG